MSKFISRAIFLLCCLFAFQTINFGQQQQTNSFFESLNSFESFEQKANFHQVGLLFKVMQFRAPYGGGYNGTSLMKDGKAFNARFTPFAIQNSRRAELDNAQVEQLKQKLAAFTENLSPDASCPVDKELYTAFIVATGAGYSRYNFVGEIPASLQIVLDSLKTEFEKAEAKEYEEFLATEKLLKEKYGDWLNKPGIVRPASSGFQTLTNNRKILLNLKGYLQPIKNEKPTEIPLYYALVNYPAGRTLGGAGGGRSSDPISANGITWSLAKNGEMDSQETQRKLEIEYNALNGTIRVADKIYKLSEGNLFYIEMTQDWRAQIEQFKINLTQPITNQTALDYFKFQLKDETLELPKQQ